jgi:hypothetical protein
MPRQLRPCGTRAAYVRHQRHGEDPCEKCVEGNRLYMQQFREQRAELPADQIPHGTNGYRNYRCRCEICTEGNKQRCARYRRDRAARKAAA